ncbi:MAG: HNH endonuclease [Opitutaceae bacterium]|nr:HNH endonuclease [Opitutaceae bacterium]
MLTAKNLPAEFVKYCRSITAKRPRTVIQHLLKYGQITTEELKNRYGYNHPPRAARDVKELGIPLERVSAKGTDGRKIAAYRFADPATSRIRKFDGRTGLSKKIKDALVSKYGCRCFIYLEPIPDAALQLDHRVPYEVGGESATLSPDDFMLLSSSANRAKSWSCEHCDNWRSIKQRELCLSCYWAYPENYTHVALKKLRRVDLLWQGDETRRYDQLIQDAAKAKLSLPDFIKKQLQDAADPS